jgi:S-adenosylmethionine:tRNA ribosyltransferase-isomerase
MTREIPINDFTYDLPPDRIALYPLNERDHSKLLVFKDGNIDHQSFINLPTQLPSNSLLVFNDTKVIPARLHFKKDTGADIEIFLLDPIAPSTLFAEAMLAKSRSSWRCTIGNIKRWTEGIVLKKQVKEILLEARLVDRNENIVEFTWSSDASFAALLHDSGETPLPPYIKRTIEPKDVQRYQTVYAHYEGAVAAPTAGLHFTPEILNSLKAKGIEMDFLTLHVSAGTFQPVKVANATEHVMHREQVVITRSTIENLLREDKFIVPVGTTSMRTLESLFWFGAKLSVEPNTEFRIAQYDPYEFKGTIPSRKEAFMQVLAYMKSKNSDTLIGETSIFIIPGYTFRVCQALITNFHQPGSTLILLVAAFTGNDWKKIYREALENNYRFLSYGDSSLLFPKK